MDSDDWDNVANGKGRGVRHRLVARLDWESCPSACVLERVKSLKEPKAKAVGGRVDDGSRSLGMYLDVCGMMRNRGGGKKRKGTTGRGDMLVYGKVR